MKRNTTSILLMPKKKKTFNSTVTFWVESKKIHLLEISGRET